MPYECETGRICIFCSIWLVTREKVQSCFNHEQIQIWTSKMTGKESDLKWVFKPTFWSAKTNNPRHWQNHWEALLKWLAHSPSVASPGRAENGLFLGPGVEMVTRYCRPIGDDASGVKDIAKQLGIIRIVFKLTSADLLSEIIVKHNEKVANGAVYTRWYYWAIEPRNALGASCSFFLALTGLIQVTRENTSSYCNAKSNRHIVDISTTRSKTSESCILQLFYPDR